MGGECGDRLPAPAANLSGAAGHIRIDAARMLSPDAQWSGPVSVTVAAGRIVSLEPRSGGAGTLTPGLIDLHNNGAFGIDFATADENGMRRALTALASRGVTAVQPTVITAPLPELAAALDRLDGFDGETGARVLGIHLEGPFLAPVRRGAHRADWLATPTPSAVAAIMRARTVTLAPELQGGLDAVRRLAAAGVVVSIGHSDADAGMALAAADAGATAVTHLFNAMRPFAHRDPGLAGVALVDPRLWCCLIVDGVHVDPIACRVAFAAAGRRVVAVTDSIPIAGLPPGTTLPFGGAPVTVAAEGAGRRNDGALAGAGITLDEGVRRMIAAGIPPADAFYAATEAPARMLRRDDLGRIAPGALADLVLWDADWVPRRVWLAGVEAPVG